MANEGNGLSVITANVTGSNMQGAPAYGAGAISTTQLGGGAGSAMIMETGFMQTAVNPIVQFQYNNAGAGNANQTIRFGSIIAEAGTFDYYNQPQSAADNAVITDQYGAGVQYTQGFGKLVSSKAVIVSQIKVISNTNNDTQLTQNFLYRQLQYDGTIKDTQANIAWTPNMSDQRENMVNMETFFLLDSQYFLEYIALATKIFSVFFKLEAANMVETFKELPKFA